MGHTAMALLQYREKDILKQAPRSITYAFKSSCHTALLQLDGTVEQKIR
jgi:hypothetical protein